MTNAELTDSQPETLSHPATNSAQFGTLQLDAHARALANFLTVVERVPDRSRAFRQRFDADVEIIQRAYNLAVIATRSRDVALPVCDWLLDNFYVIREQIRDIKEHLPASFFRELPKLRDARPRVHEIARELVAHCDAALDEEMMIRFVDQFQLNAELTIGESWAFPVMLRLALVEQLQAICSQLIQELQSTDDVQRIIEDWDSGGRFFLEQHSSLRCAPTLLGLYAALRARGREYSPAIAALDRHVQSMGWQLPELQRLEQHRLAANQVSMGNIITSMRLLAALDWIVFFERTNRCERILRDDPAGIYANMDFASRNRYRSAVERLSKRSGASETEVAKQALMRAATSRSEWESSKPKELPPGCGASNSELRSHLGYWLVDVGRAEVERAIAYRVSGKESVVRWLREHAFATFFMSIVVWTSLICGLLVFFAIELGVPTVLAIVMGALLIVPATEAAVLLTNAVITRLLPPRLLPKLELLEGIPVQHPTIIVIPSLIGNEAAAQTLLARLEDHYLANMDPQLSFALLTDLPDAPSEELPTDAAIIEFAVAGVRRLNKKYGEDGGGPFFLFHRKRQWNPSENKWMGWERKRGKLMEFGRILSGSAGTSYAVQEGNLDRLTAFRCDDFRPLVITLDADTVLPRGVAKRLIGAMAHPLNRPVTSADGCVERGYSILQPRIGINLGDSVRTRYVRTQANNPGIDPYVSATSDVYQDLFGEGSFTGKGIYDLRAFEQTLHDAFPENLILSHDLIEGCHARVALVTDVEVFDGYPPRYDGDARRVHRWVRGDWQISPWLFPRVPHAAGRIRNKLSSLSRWKIFDNLRRSLVAPSMLLFLIIGWLAIPEHSLLWSLAAGLILVTPLVIQAVTAALAWTRRHSWREQIKHYLYGLATTAEHLSYTASFLPHKAWQMVDAILRTLYRMRISRRRLLEWESAAAVESRLASRRWAVLQQLTICSVVGIGLALLMPRSALPWASPWLVAWLVAPVVGHLISQPQRRRSAASKAVDHQWLCHVASGTWAFFERYVNESGNWLPPDNVQEYPREKVATRISPTNEGFFLVSALVAQRLGFIGVSSLLELWEKNLHSWLGLEQLHGHHFNWYETARLATLQPRYVSTVDSGNLAACYLTLCHGIPELGESPLLDRRLLDGVRGSLQWLNHYASAAQNAVRGQHPHPSTADTEVFKKLASITAHAHLSLPENLDTFSRIDEFNEALRQTISNLASMMEQLDLESGAANLAAQSRIVAARFEGICRDTAELMPWLATLVAIENEAPSELSWVLKTLTPEIPLRSLAQLSSLFEAQFEAQFKGLNEGAAMERKELPLRFKEEVQRSTAVAQDRWQRLMSIAHQCEAAALKMDFRFLYSKRRKLFSIGFNADEGRLDRSHYDLLCSECRIASYLAIAKGDVETEHWFRLGRQAAEFHGQHVLLSWGGTMFEYLMPPLFQKSFEGTLLDTSCLIAISRQQDYGRQRNVPWGISESAFSAMATNSDYQYKSFGVPGLGLKRGLSKELVISPYSTGMALPFVPQEATENLKRIAELAMGSWGFYDAVDYTPSRLRHKQTANVVRNYMAHHQGMTMLGIANTIGDSMIQRWFHAYPLVRANELLLQERVPAYIDSEVPNPDEVEGDHVVREETTLLARHISGTHSSTPRTLLLSNGQFSTMLTHAGGGYCCTDSLQLTRWRSDPTCDPWGTFIYLRDRSSGKVWSATYQPTHTVPDHYEVMFSVDKGEIHRRQGDIETTLEVVVSPEHQAEVRQLRITNHAATQQSIEVTSYLEVALSSQAADVAHPAFQKLFIETEFLSEDATLIARRRPRDASQTPHYMLHTLSTPGDSQATVQYESDREKFIGRGQNLEFPAALQSDRLTGTVGAVLDPILSLRCTVTIAPSESVVVAFTTAAATSREQALSLADLFHDMRGVQRAFELAWASTQIELRYLQLTAKQSHVFQQLAGNLLYPDAAIRGDAAKIATNRLGQSSLWHFGISGDLPMILVRITESNQLDLVQELVSAHSFLRSRGLRVDLIVSNDYPGTYFDSLQDQLQTLINESQIGESKGGRIYLLRGAQLSNEVQGLLESVAAVVLHGDHGTLAQQLQDAQTRRRKVKTDGLSRPALISSQFTRQAKRSSPPSPSSPTDASDGEFHNGFGQFVGEGERYEMILAPNQQTPAPWSNVIANPRLGCLITESGGGYTWFMNSRENKLTEWSNDPVCDALSEIVYLKDSESGAVWSPLPSGNAQQLRHITHGQGFTRFLSTQAGIETEVLVSVAESLPVKFVRVRLHNQSRQTRRLALAYFAETVLGVTREQTALHQVSSYEEDTQTLLMSNGYNPDFAAQCMFLSVLGGGQRHWTGDRHSFIGRDGSLSRPAGLHNQLNQRTGAGLDPCMVLQTELELSAGAIEEVIFLLGAETDSASALELVRSLQPENAAKTQLAAARTNWQSFLATLTVKTPNTSLNCMVNHWLPYQVLSCRLWGRSAFYQSGGAYGFRDQLQDCMALVYARPSLVREHILRAAARQYVQGDVQHWWHIPSGKGTRTRFSDDFLFLPYVTLHYLEKTGDQSILDENVPFIESPLLREDEHERYEQPKVSEESASLLEHCRRALQHGLRLGEHGLPLMGCGDWNDGMNHVGSGGRGESVWVAWFQIDIFERFSEVFQQRGDTENAALYRTKATELRQAIELHAWDGSWYKRAFFDDGTPLGSSSNDECQIDSLSQSWAVIAGGPRDRAQIAFRSALERLVLDQPQILLLFTPPFDKTPLDPGYIKGYLPGVRENGGQYTHAAAWLVQAAAMLGDGNLAMRLFDMLNPILHSDSPDKATRYKVEPYVIAADVYAVESHLGRGGWTWYTGSAAWIYRVAIEYMLGIRITADRLTVNPVLPDDWSEFQFTYRRNETVWEIMVKRTTITQPPSHVDLKEDGQRHKILLEVAY